MSVQALDRKIWDKDLLLVYLSNTTHQIDKTFNLKKI